MKRTGDLEMKSMVVAVPVLLPVPAVQGGAVERWVQEVCDRLVKPSRRLAVVYRPAYVAGTPANEYIGIPWSPIERWLHKLNDKVTGRNPLRYVVKMKNVFSFGSHVL